MGRFIYAQERMIALTTVMERHIFPGANTPLGFYSCFPQIISQDDAQYYYFIKGGPGTGKSSLMRAVGEQLAAAGQPVEYFHCSSDPQSLDGVYFPQIGVAMIDATAPHSYDPRYPAAAGRILELGAYWDSAKIAAHREDIQRITRKNSQAFATAYRYLAAARSLFDEARDQVRRNLPDWAADREAVRFAFEEMAAYPAGHGRGDCRRLFATGFTPGGHISFLDSILQGYDRVYAVEGLPGSGCELMAKLQETALSRGLDAEAYPCIMDPAGPPEHLLLPSLGVAIISTNDYHRSAVPIHGRIDMGQYIDEASLDTDALAFIAREQKTLINAALGAIGKSKDLHDELEQYYAPNMNFDAVSALLDDVVAEIKQMIPAAPQDSAPRPQLVIEP